MEYFRPKSLDEALQRLNEFDDARPIAGGATLVAMMNADLLAPEALVSLAAIDELKGIHASPAGITIGAMTTHDRIAADDRLIGDLGIVRLAAGEIGHPAIRAVGTIGGSIAHADPAADFPTALTAANASIEILGNSGRRRLPAVEFFQDYFTTALNERELVIAIHLANAQANGTAVYRKITRSDGDFAIASMALSGSFREGRCEQVRIAVGGCGATPVQNLEVNELLLGATVDSSAVTQAAELLAETCDPIDDVRGSAEYRRLLVRRLLPAVFSQAATGAANDK